MTCKTCGCPIALNEGYNTGTGPRHRMPQWCIEALKAEAQRWRDAHDKIIDYAAGVEEKAKESIAECAAEGGLAAQETAVDPQEDVRAFMEAFGQPLPPTPQWPDQKTMDLRVRLIAEEFCEWLRDSGYTFNVRVFAPHAAGTIREVYDNNEYLFTPRSLPKSADALIDLLYVTIGALLAMGIDMWPLWKAVQRANMAKTGGPVVNGKQMKPDGWTPPDIKGELRKQGWSGE